MEDVALIAESRPDCILELGATTPGTGGDHAQVNVTVGSSLAAQPNRTR